MKEALEMIFLWTEIAEIHYQKLQKKKLYHLNSEIHWLIWNDLIDFAKKWIFACKKMFLINQLK